MQHPVADEHVQQLNKQTNQTKELPPIQGIKQMMPYIYDVFSFYVLQILDFAQGCEVHTQVDVHGFDALDRDL